MVDFSPSVVGQQIMHLEVEAGETFCARIDVKLMKSSMKSAIIYITQIF